LRILVGAIVALGAAQAVGQAPRVTGAASAAALREEGVRWQTLTPSQREALAPLERDWPGIDAARKQKWVTLAARMKTLTPEERARINDRMVEWAKLTPAERGQARLRFEEARQLPVPDRPGNQILYVTAFRPDGSVVNVSSDNLGRFSDRSRVVLGAAAGLLIAFILVVLTALLGR